METYMKDNNYSPINNNQFNKYRALIKNLMQLGPNDWPKFQEQLKKVHSA